MNKKHWDNIYHAHINLNLMVGNIAQIKNGITINADATVKIWRTLAKKILVHVLWKRLKFRKYYWRLSGYMWWNCRSYKNCFNKNFPNILLKRLFQDISIKKS